MHIYVHRITNAIADPVYFNKHSVPAFTCVENIDEIMSNLKDDETLVIIKVPPSPFPPLF